MELIYKDIDYRPLIHMTVSVMMIIEKCDKNIKRDKPLEALYYYHLILRYITKFLRLKHGLYEKAEYDLKHIYRDVPREETKQIEKFYNVSAQDIEMTLPELEKWIKDL